MKPFLIAIIVVLCQYPVAVLTLMKLFRCKLEKTQMLIWNFVIILIPFLGAASFWIYYFIAKNKIKENAEKRAALPPTPVEEEDDDKTEDGKELSPSPSESEEDKTDN